MEKSAVCPRRSVRDRHSRKDGSELYLVSLLRRPVNAAEDHAQCVACMTNHPRDEMAGSNSYGLAFEAAGLYIS